MFGKTTKVLKESIDATHHENFGVNCEQLFPPFRDNNIYFKKKSQLNHKQQLWDKLVDKLICLECFHKQLHKLNLNAGILTF